jgi:hypothetical protein
LHMFANDSIYIEMATCAYVGNSCLILLYRDPVALCVSERVMHAHETFPGRCHCIVIDCVGVLQIHSQTKNYL